MLTHIHIQDLVIVRALSLDLAPGMTAMTGETGAGKSILIDGLGLALGDKADPTMIRAGSGRAEERKAGAGQDGPGPTGCA